MSAVALQVAGVDDVGLIEHAMGSEKAFDDFGQFLFFESQLDT